MVRCIRLFAALAVLATVADLSAQDYKLGFEIDGAVGCGGDVTGAPGAKVRLNCFATYELLAGADDKVSAVTVSIGVAGAGVVVDIDKNARGGALCGKLCVGKLIFGEVSDGSEILFHAADRAPPEINNQGPGAVSVVTCDLSQGFFLPKGKFRAMPFFVEVTIPETAGTLEISFKDGLKNKPDLDAYTNNFAFGTSQVDLATGGVTATNCILNVKPSVKGQVPGDANQGGTLDALDAITLLNHYFNGDPARLPCGNGSVYDSANLALLDANGDRELDMADAVHNLRQVFLGGAPHAGGTVCKPIIGCPGLCDG